MKHVVATWKYREPSQHLLKYKGKPRKTCVEMAASGPNYTSSPENALINKSVFSVAHTILTQPFQINLLEFLALPTGCFLSQSVDSLS